MLKAPRISFVHQAKHFHVSCCLSVSLVVAYFLWLEVNDSEVQARAAPEVVSPGI
jgi:hypothetical protein